MICWIYYLLFGNDFALSLVFLPPKVYVYVSDIHFLFESREFVVSCVYGLC